MKNKKIVLIILLIIFVFLCLNRKNILKIFYQKEYSELVLKYSQRYSVDRNLIFALIKSESNFDKNAISNKNAIGLMQLMEDTAKDVIKTEDIEINHENIKEELLNAESNINIGTKYLSILQKKYNNIEVTLAAYNAGIGTVDNWIEKGIIKADGSDIENIPYKETNNYVRRIIRDYKIYKDLYQ